jgi:hypothetical protein
MLTSGVTAVTRLTVSILKIAEPNKDDLILADLDKKKPRRQQRTVTELIRAHILGAPELKNVIDPSNALSEEGRNDATA